MASSVLPVLIVGAGPTGLNLANLLAQYNVPFRLIDQKSEPIHTSNALAVQARSIEMWDSMGIADKALAEGRKILGLALNGATRPIGKISFANAELPTRFPFLLGLAQADSERIMTEHLSAQGGKIERGITLINAEQTTEAVAAHVQHSNGEKEIIQCQWLIAADGSHSTLRTTLKLDFPGATLPEKFIMMDADITADFDSEYGQTFLSPHGPLVFLSMPKFTRIICSVTHDAGIKDFTQPTLEDFNYVIAKRTRAKVTIDNPIWISHFVTHHRLIDQYCHGRILFAGDSAHIHSPVGGQGMNTGMQDVYNLAWKLASVIKNKAHPHILDTYNLERRKIAEDVLINTTKMTRLVTIKNPLLIALRNYVMGFLLQRKSIQQKMLAEISEIAISYPPNKIIMHDLPPTHKIKAGQRAPEIAVLQKRPSDLKHLVLLFTGASRSDEIKTLTAWIHQNHADFFEPIIIKTPDEHRDYDIPQGGLFIIRPDRYIGLCSNKIDSDLLKHYWQHISSAAHY